MRTIPSPGKCSWRSWNVLPLITIGPSELCLCSKQLLFTRHYSRNVPILRQCKRRTRIFSKGLENAYTHSKFLHAYFASVHSLRFWRTFPKAHLCDVDEPRTPTTVGFGSNAPPNVKAEWQQKKNKLPGFSLLCNEFLWKAQTKWNTFRLMSAVKYKIIIDQGKKQKKKQNSADDHRDQITLHRGSWPTALMIWSTHRWAA